MGTHIQEELISDILSRLPVNSLLRFKCVSKNWRTLITEPCFKKNHLNHAKNQKKFQKMLIQRSCKKDGKCSFYCSSLSRRRIVKDLKISTCLSGFYHIHSCCDGLVLLGIQYDADNYSLLLWNPSTRESIVLPPYNRYNDFTYGLGYDSTSDDYKVLKVSWLNEEDDGAPNEILALKSGSWRKLDCNFCHGSHAMDCLAFVQGAFHWIGLTQKWSWTIFSCDVSNEVYREVPLPEELRTAFVNFNHGITELGGMLSTHCVYARSETASFNLWVMKEYGVKESWTKLFTIRDTRIHSIVPIIPKYIFPDGEVLLSCKKGTVFRTSKGPYGISDLVWPLVDDDSDEDTFLLMDGLVYTESLISPVVNH